MSALGREPKEVEALETGTPVPATAVGVGALRPPLAIRLLHLRQARSLPWGAAIVVAYACGAYLSVNYLLPDRLSADAQLYVAQPAIWGFLAFLSLLLLWRSKAASGVTQAVLALATLAAAFQVAWLMGAGTMFGFGYSPYSRQPVNMAQNGLYVVTLLVGLELSRAYLIALFAPRRPFLSLTVISLFYALLLIPVGTYNVFRGPESSFEAVGVTFLPAVAQSLVASYLAARSGPLPAIIYRGGIEAFYWFSPILPNLEWTTAAFIGTLGPVIALLALRGFREEDTPADVRTNGGDVSAVWIVPSIVLVALLWFNLGMLGVQPAVVSGVSMEPSMEVGDLVLTRPVAARDLEVDDVVKFGKQGVPVIHRIVQIEDTPQGQVFVTKGDNNNTTDDPILPGEIEGKVVFVVPKVGWVSIALGKLLSQVQ